jgi:sugar O-acyltransferase (sialic acid O-acetyltransferase NeuD family)
MLLYGNGGHAQVIQDCLKALHLPLTGIFDDKPFPEEPAFLGIYNPTVFPESSLLLAIGDNATRQKVSQHVRHHFGILIHPTAVFSAQAEVGEGTVVFPQAVVQAGVKLGKQVILNTGCIAEHDCRIADFVHLAPRSVLCGGVQVGEGSLIGVSATVLPGIKIGKWATVGAGAVVTQDVPDFATVTGIPAKFLSKTVISSRIYLSPPHLSGTEMDFVQDAFAKNWVTTAGENIEAFERAIYDFTGAKFAVALNTGTAAIHLGLILLGVEAGDTVICPAFTFAATANPVVYQKAMPVFIDSESRSWNICPQTARQAILNLIRQNQKPKALIVVHLYGQTADMQEFIKISQEFEVPILEDAAEALGSVYQGKPVGTLGKIGVISFNGNKIITTGGGGILLTDDEETARKALFLATQAREPAPHYQHESIGYNYRMSNIAAGIGRGQMQVLPERIIRKRRIQSFYRQALTDIPAISFQPEPENTFSNCWLTAIQINPGSGVTPEKLRLALVAENIEARPLWKPLHLQPVFQDCPYFDNGNTSGRLFEQGLCLPSGTQLSDSQLEKIISVIRRTFEI